MPEGTCPVRTSSTGRTSSGTTPTVTSPGLMWSLPVLTFGRNLPGRRPNGNYESRDPDHQQADFLYITHDLVVAEEVHRAGEQSYERGEDEENIEILASVHFLDHDAGNGEDDIHGNAGAVYPMRFRKMRSRSH